MKHKRFEENILVDEAYTNYGKEDKNADKKKGVGIAKHFADTLELEERKKWFHQMPEEPSTITKIPTPEQIEEIRKEANSALHGDTLAYETKQNRNGSSDHQWAKTLLNKGAIGDRVAAATILIQDNPLYNLTALRNLINSVKPAKKKDGIIIIDALSELLISDLLIPDMKLRTFEQHPLGHLDEMTSGNKQARRNILKLWYYEDQLKELYGTYVEALNKFAHDSVEANKEKAVSSMSYLLMHHPEREKMLLTNIINKLGDPSQAVASKVIYHLCQLLYNHPNMKSVVLGEIEKMLFRTNISPRAQYYGICFLNQFFLGKDDARIAENLIRIYFSFFKASIKKGDIDTRLMSAILTGVKRAYPFADKDRLSETPAHIDAIHKLVHLAPINTAIHALALLFHISAASNVTADRYYTVLYRKLNSPDIFNTTHSALLFSLIYKSLKQDKEVNRVTSFVKRLLQLSCYMLLAQAIVKQNVLTQNELYFRYYTALYRKLTSPDIFNTTHSALLFSLIYKSLKQDKEVNRVTSFVKRLLQLSCYMLLAQAIVKQNVLTQNELYFRYYTALYRKLTSPDIFNTTHSALLFSLIYKSLKQDKEVNRVTSFVKRLLQLSCYMLLAQAIVKQNVLTQNELYFRYYTALYRKLTSPDIFNTTHSALLFSLIYKSLKQDKEVNRVTSFVKRLLQLSCYMLLAQAIVKQNVLTQNELYFRYYTALYRKLTSPDIFNTTHSALLFSLIYKSLKQDKEVNRVTSFVKRLLQLSCYMLLAQAIVKHNVLTQNKLYFRYYTALYRKLTSPDIFNTTHSALLFSLIYKSLKQDKEVNRVTSFVKRLLQLSCYMIPAQACGMLFLISQVLKDGDKKDAVKLVWTKKEVKEEPKEEPESTEVHSDTEDTQNEIANGTLDSVEDDSEVKEEDKSAQKIDLLRGDKKDLLMEDDDETYVDLKIDDQGNIKPERKRSTTVIPGWHHARVKKEEPAAVEDKDLETKIKLKKTINMDREIKDYNPLARNPQFAGAECSAYLELRILSQHFHPTVKLFAESLLNEQLIQYSGDPLKDFAGIRFLDRFVFKNPKKRTERPDDEGVKKVKGSHPKFAMRKNYTAKGIKSLPVNSASYLNEDVKKIPVDEKFLYDFLQKRREGQDSEDDDSDNESVASEDFEKYLDSMTGAKDTANSDEELDYLADMEATKQKRPKKAGKSDDDDQLGSDDEEEELGGEEGDIGEDDEDSDGELNISGDDDEPQLSGEDDEELLQEDSDDEDDLIDLPGKKGKGQKFKLKGKDNLGSLFASAEEFSTLLEETASNKKQGSSQAVSNTDNSSTKQLAWEEKRDRWVKGFNKKILGKNSKKNKGKNKKFGKPGNTNFNKMAEKKGGKRKGTSIEGAGGKKKKSK